MVIAIVAFFHFYFLILEIFFWDTSFGRKVFAMTPDYAKTTKVLASNQGVYNGFLSAGLVWGLTLGAAGNSVKIFFLGCVIVAGIFGGLTANRKILWIQALPAVIALVLKLLE